MPAKPQDQAAKIAEQTALALEIMNYEPPVDNQQMAANRGNVGGASKKLYLEEKPSESNYQLSAEHLTELMPADLDGFTAEAVHDIGQEISDLDYPGILEKKGTRIIPFGNNAHWRLLIIKGDKANPEISIYDSLGENSAKSVVDTVKGTLKILGFEKADDLEIGTKDCPSGDLAQSDNQHCGDFCIAKAHQMAQTQAHPNFDDELINGLAQEDNGASLRGRSIALSKLRDPMGRLQALVKSNDALGGLLDDDLLAQAKAIIGKKDDELVVELNNLLDKFGGKDFTNEVLNPNSAEHRQALEQIKTHIDELSLDKEDKKEPLKKALVLSLALGKPHANTLQNISHAETATFKAALMSDKEIDKKLGDKYQVIKDKVLKLGLSQRNNLAANYDENNKGAYRASIKQAINEKDDITEAELSDAGIKALNAEILKVDKLHQHLTKFLENATVEANHSNAIELLDDLWALYAADKKDDVPAKLHEMLKESPHLFGLGEKGVPEDISLEHVSKRYVSQLSPIWNGIKETYNAMKAKEQDIPLTPEARVEQAKPRAEQAKPPRTNRSRQQQTLYSESKDHMPIVLKHSVTMTKTQHREILKAEESNTTDKLPGDLATLYNKIKAMGGLLKGTQGSEVIGLRNQSTGEFSNEFQALETSGEDKITLSEVVQTAQSNDKKAVTRHIQIETEFSKNNVSVKVPTIGEWSGKDGTKEAAATPKESTAELAITLATQWLQNNKGGPSKDNPLYITGTDAPLKEAMYVATRMLCNQAGSKYKCDDKHIHVSGFEKKNVFNTNIFGQEKPIEVKKHFMHKLITDKCMTLVKSKADLLKMKPSEKNKVFKEALNKVKSSDKDEQTPTPMRPGSGG